MAEDNGKEIAKLQREISNLTDAIASGALKASPALAGRLHETEEKFASLRVRPAPRDPEQLLPRLAERSKSAIDNLERTMTTDPHRARREITEHVGAITVNTTPEEIRLKAQKGHREQAFLAATGSGTRQVVMVAGACSRLIAL